MSRALRFAFGATVTLGALALAAACSLEDVAFDGKSCPCADGWVCDTAANVCVRPGDDAGNAPDATPGCVGDGCRCETNADCKDPTRSKCSAKKTCVECTASPDSCPAGSYCNELEQCTVGCKSNDDCKISPNAPLCNVATRRCGECVTAADCKADAGLVCSPSGSCVEGCDLDAGQLCPAGKTCCGTFCLDTKTDVLNCGACAKACDKTNGTPRCSAGACAWTCASGFGHCEGANNTGCETNLRTTVTRCGSCSKNCNTAILNANSITCNAGTCAYAACKPGFASCDGNTANGCECACGKLDQACCPGDTCEAPLRCLGGGMGNKSCR